MNMAGRFMLTGVVVIAASFFYSMFDVASTVAVGQMAGNQFQNSNTAYLANNTSLWVTDFMRDLSIIIPLILLLFIWRSPLKSWITSLSLILLVIGASNVHVEKAYAFAETTDRTEIINILPNESAFFIPSVGANKDSQSMLDSEQYLNDNKVSSKDFTIPHHKLTGSGGKAWIGNGWDIYVPDGRLILVDRTPFSKEWVSSKDRGSSDKNQGQYCQTKEGLNITTGIAIGTTVSEKNAAKFLYNFGVRNPVGDRNDIHYIFASVYYGRSLSEVMEDVVRPEGQILTCNEFATRTLDQANAESKQIIDSIQKNLKIYLDSVGITLTTIGWSDTFTFDADVQKAINDRYVASALRDLTPTLEALVQLKVQEGIATGVSTKGLPLVITPDILNAIGGIGRPATK